MSAALLPRCLRFAQLSPRQRRLTAESAVLLLSSLVLRRVLSTRRLLRLSPMEDRLSPKWRERGAWQTEVVAERLAALERAAHALSLTNCLVRATALRLLLRRGGVASTLHLGVRKTEDKKLAAHAWVSVGGSVVLGAEELGRSYAEILHKEFAPRTGAVR